MHMQVHRVPLCRPFTSQQVKGGDKIDLGKGHVVEFIMAPNLHWYVMGLCLKRVDSGSEGEHGIKHIH